MLEFTHLDKTLVSAPLIHQIIVNIDCPLASQCSMELARCLIWLISQQIFDTRFVFLLWLHMQLKVVSSNFGSDGFYLHEEVPVANNRSGSFLKL